MFLLSVIAATAALAADSGSLDCKGIYRKTDPNTGRTVEHELALPVTYSAGGIVKYEGDLQGRAFSVIEEKDSILAQITQAPDYTKGVVNRGVTDGSGRFNLSDVDGFLLYRLECKKRQ
jgi:hypothetical protein